MDRIQPTHKHVVSDANTLTDTDSVGTLDDTCPLPLSVCVVNTVWDVLKGEILGQGGTDISRVALQDFIHYYVLKIDRIIKIKRLFNFDSYNINGIMAQHDAFSAF